jgi:hypothetical protein
MLVQEMAGGAWTRRASPRRSDATPLRPPCRHGRGRPAAQAATSAVDIRL